MDSKASPRKKGGKESADSNDSTSAVVPSVRESQLEAEIILLRESLNSSHTRIQELIAEKQEIEESAKQQEHDALDVIGLLQKAVDDKSHEINRMNVLLKAKDEDKQKALDAARQSHAKEISEITAQLHERDVNLKVVQQEFAVLKDFRKKRTDLMNELEMQRSEMQEMEKRHGEMLARMERKYFEEKMRLERSANSKIQEVATKAHEEAISTLDAATKNIFKENIKLAEALKVHMDQDQSLAKKNSELESKNQRLLEENDLNDGVLKDQIKLSKQKSDIIKDLRSKIANLELVLSQIASQFEQERIHLREGTKKQIDDIRQRSDTIQKQLVTKLAEMKYIKRLCQHILDQRTDLETFFIDSLETVRQQKLEALQQRAKEAFLQNNSQRLAQLETMKLTPVTIPISQEDKLEALSFEGSTAEPRLSQVEQALDVTKLDWEDKEKIIRDMFIRMNTGKIK